MSFDRSPFLTAAEVAALYRVSPSTVSKWVREGRLNCDRTPGGGLRFRRSDIEALLPGAPNEPEVAR